MTPAFPRKATIPRAADISIRTVDQHEERGDDRAVDEEQHHRDHHEGDRGDLRGALAAHLELIGDERRRAGDIGLDTRRRLRVVNDVADGVDGLVGQRRALIAREVHLNVGGLAVRALRARRGQRVPPEVLDVLDVLGVLLELADQGVVELVGVRAERLDRLPGRSWPRCRNRTRRRPDRCASSPCSDGASGEFSATLCVCPTSSSCGTAMFVMAASSHPEQQDRQRKPADGVRYARPRALLWSLMRTCPGRRCRR